MIKAVWIKFNQHENLKQLLLQTDDKILIEDAGQNDNFYGNGNDGNGNNLLGCILMAVRDLIREQQKNIPVQTIPQTTLSASNTTLTTPPASLQKSQSQKQVHSVLVNQSNEVPQPQQQSALSIWWQNTRVYKFFAWFASFFHD
jgi:hypothetical protein